MRLYQALAILSLMLISIILPAAAYGTSSGAIGEQWLTIGDTITGQVYAASWFKDDGNYIYACGGFYGAYNYWNLTKCWRSDSTATVFPAIDPPTKSNGGLAYSAYAEYHGKWYMMGGMNHTFPSGVHIFYVYNSTWSSADHGATWVQVNSTSAWLARAAARALVYNDRLYLIGGTNYTSQYAAEPRPLWAYADVWWLDTANESAGIWTRATRNDGMPARFGHAVQVIDNKMWVFGGAYSDDIAHATWYADGWYSTDGVTWTKAWEDWVDKDLWDAAIGEWINRDGTHVWLMGGGYKNASGSTAQNVALFATQDGVTWWMVNSSSTMQKVGTSAGFEMMNFTPPLTAANPTAIVGPGLYCLGLHNSGSTFYSKVSLQMQVASTTPATAGGSSPLAVAWTDTTTGLSTNWLWDFKDGYFSYERNASHVFSSTGTFPVLFTVGSYFGQSQTTASVTVTTQQVNLASYIPKSVRFVVLAANGTPLANVTVVATFNQSTLGSLGWASTLWGVNPSTNPTMFNSSAAMWGVTGTDGVVVFTMLPPFQYYIRFSGGGIPTTHQIVIFPQQNEYNIWIPGTAYVPSFAEALSTTLPSFEASDLSTVNLSFTYNDTSTSTNNVTFLVWFSNGTLFYSKSWTGASVVNWNYTIPNVWGNAYYWGYFAIKNDGANATSVVKGITTRGPSGVMVDLGLGNPLYYLWLSFALIMLIGGIFTSERLAPFGNVLVPMMAGFFYWFGWITAPSVGPIIFIVALFGALSYLKWRHRSMFGIGGPGSILLNITTFMILLQLSVSLVSMMPVWGSDPGNFASSPNNVYSTWTISKAATDMGNPAGGLGGTIDAIWLTITLVAQGFMYFFTNFLPAMFNLTGWIFSAFGIVGSPMLTAVSILIQAGWYILILLFIFQIAWKPPIGTADL